MVQEVREEFTHTLVACKGRQSQGSVLRGAGKQLGEQATHSDTQDRKHFRLHGSDLSCLATPKTQTLVLYPCDSFHKLGGGGPRSQVQLAFLGPTGMLLTPQNCLQRILQAEASHRLTPV